MRTIYRVKSRKYGNKLTEFNGEKYHSKFEAKVAQELHYRKLAGEITEIERQVKIDLRAYDKHICNYIIDFVITLKDGTKEFIEAKGFSTPEWRLKWKLFEAQMKVIDPEAKLTVIRDNGVINANLRNPKA